MSCCGREEVPKKKKPKAVFEQRPESKPQDTNILYPKTNKHREESKKYSKQHKKKLKQKLTKLKVQQVNHGGQLTAVGQAQKGPEKLVLKKLQQCRIDLEELDKKYKGTKDKWTDQDFSYPAQYLGQRIFWKRPEEFIKQPDLFPDDISPNDIKQGRLQDCYFLASMAALAEKDFRIINLFTTKEYNPNGYYIVKLFFNGIYQEVIVDDLFPVDNLNRAVFVRPSHDKYIWTLVLQKCWAKLLNGYPNASLGYNSQAFQTLTGAPTTTYILSQYITKDDPKGDKIFQKLLESQQRQYCTITSVYNYKGANEQQMMAQGFASGHVYTLLGAFLVKLKDGRSVKLVQIRNPWGSLDSKLAWRDNDPQWELVSAEQKQRINYSYNKNDNDGVYYMDWDTFIEVFNYFCSICEIDDNANYLYLELQVEDRVPIYLQVNTDGSPQELAIYFVQQMQSHFKEDNQIDYTCINVIVSKQGLDKNNQKTYEFMGAFSYFRKVVDNYFTLPKKKFSKGKYILRLYVFSPKQSKKAKTPLVVGLYSPAVVGLQIEKDIDNMEFIQKNCIYQAKKHGKKEKLNDDPYSWVCRQVFPDTNLGYLVFHHGNKSHKQSYNLKLDTKCDKRLYYLLDHLNQQEFTIQSQKGYQEVVVFAYVQENLLGMDRNLYPNYKPQYILPTPVITPK